MHIVDITKFMIDEYEYPIKVYVDNTSAIKLMETIKVNNRVKHINMRINFIREMVLSQFIELHFVPTDFNVADMLTKPLSVEKFLRLRDILMRGHGGVEPYFGEEAYFVLTAAMLSEIDEILSEDDGL